MSDQFVSIIVPTYNRSYCISRAIDSVRRQTHLNWEVVLVDDGSTDDTAALIDSRYGDDSRVRYLYQSNGGVSAARNMGIRESRGDYVAFLDSDDQWQPWKLETQLACFRFFPEVGMVWTNFEAVDAAGKVVNHRYLRTMYDSYNHFSSFESLFDKSRALSDVVDSGREVETGARVYVGNIYTSMLRGNLVHTSTVMLTRARIAEVKEFDESLTLSGEDYDFHFRTCKWGDVCLADVPSTLYQLGFEDRLTLHKKAIAQNFLKTVQGAIARESGTATFPPAMINEVLAEAHGWIAEELFKSADYAGARKHALLALRHRIWQPRLICAFGVALVPSMVSKVLLRSYRSCKSLMSRGKRT